MNVNLFQLSISHLQYYTVLAVINIVTFICSNKKLMDFLENMRGLNYLSNVSNFKTN